jgi:hypothetical protein
VHIYPLVVVFQVNFFGCTASLGISVLVSGSMTIVGASKVFTMDSLDVLLFGLEHRTQRLPRLQKKQAEHTKVFNIPVKQ